MFKELRSLKAQIIQPSREELRKIATPHEHTTEFGSASYISDIKSRSAKYTAVTTEDGLTDDDFTLLKDVREHLQGRELIQFDTVIAQPSEHLTMRLIIPKEFAHIAYGWSFINWDEGEIQGEPDIVTIDVPDWETRRMLVDPDTMTNVLCGTDYTGEVKKSGLRLAMYHMKKKGGLGLHAGSKNFTVKNSRTDKLEEKGCLFFGLSGTGKSTLSCHHCGIQEDGEGQLILQDDVVLLDAEGKALGTEDNFYLKTIGVTKETQPIIYDALVDSDTVLENVMVHEDGTVDFMSDKITSNGRAVVVRTKMPYTDPDQVDMESTDYVFFITRNALMPPVARLNSLQAAKYFMLGETVETGAGDPNEIGQAKRVVGFNPFIIGSQGEEGNRFYDIISSLAGVETFIINTGAVEGSKSAHDITLKETTEIIRNILRSEFEWIVDERTGLEVSTEVDLYRECFEDGEFKEKWEKFEQERLEYLQQFSDLNHTIVQA